MSPPRFDPPVNPEDSTQGKLHGRVALITGATSGIGRATALLFAGQGAAVALTGRRADRGASLVAEIQSFRGDAAFVAADHSREEDCLRAVDSAVRHFGQLDTLFNNAGVVIGGSAEDTSEADWTATFEINVRAVWRMSRLVLPHLRARGGGAIVNNSSDWGMVGARDAVAYCASKGAVIQMTRAMAMDHARESIRVNAVCPGDMFVERWIEDGYFEGPEE